MAQAKITVNDAQAKALGLLVYRKKMNPKTAIIFEPKSGINFRLTGPGDYIEVPTNADVSNLKNFQKAGYFDVIEGTVLPHAAAFSSISLNGTTLTLTFSAAVTAPQLTSTVNGAATDDIILKVNGIAVAATFAAVSAKTTITTSIDVTLEDISVQITQSGASKIKDANRSAILPATKTTSVAPIFQNISVGGVGNTMLTLTFNEAVYTAGVSSTGLGLDTDDLVILVDNTATALTIGAVEKAAAANTLTVDMGAAPTSSVSVKITSTGAAKILDTDDTAVGGVLTRNYSMTATDFTTFTFAEETGMVTPNALDHTIDIEVENGTNVAALVATFTLSSGATVAVGATPQVSGTTANDFTNPVTYTVTAQNGTTTQDWTVTVTHVLSVGKDMLTYNFTDLANEALTADVTGIVDATAHTVALTVPNGTVVTALIATFTLSPDASLLVGETAQVSGTTANDFTNPVVYTVKAEDNSTQTWTVTVAIAEA